MCIFKVYILINYLKKSNVIIKCVCYFWSKFVCFLKKGLNEGVYLKEKIKNY